MTSPPCPAMPQTARASATAGGGFCPSRWANAGRVPPEQIRVRVDVVGDAPADDGLRRPRQVAGEADPVRVGGEERAVDGRGQAVVGHGRRHPPQVVLPAGRHGRRVERRRVQADAGHGQVGPDPVDEATALVGLGQAVTPVRQAAVDLDRGLRPVIAVQEPTGDRQGDGTGRDGGGAERKANPSHRCGVYMILDAQPPTAIPNRRAAANYRTGTIGPTMTVGR